MTDAEACNPFFLLYMQMAGGEQRARAVLQFPSVEEAYCDVCAGIPDAAADLLRAGLDPMQCSYLICTIDGEVMLEVPFGELIHAKPLRVPVSEVATMPPSEDAGILARSAALRASASAARERSCHVIRRSRQLISAAHALRPDCSL